MHFSFVSWPETHENATKLHQEPYFVYGASGLGKTYLVRQYLKLYQDQDSDNVNGNDNANVNHETCYADNNVNDKVNDNVNVNVNDNVNQETCFPDVNDNVNQGTCFADVNDNVNVNGKAG